MLIGKSPERTDNTDRNQKSYSCKSDGGIAVVIHNHLIFKEGYES